MRLLASLFVLLIAVVASVWAVAIETADDNLIWTGDPSFDAGKWAGSGCRDPPVGTMGCCIKATRAPCPTNGVLSASSSSADGYYGKYKQNLAGVDKVSAFTATFTVPNEPPSTANLLYFGASVKRNIALGFAFAAGLVMYGRTPTSGSPSWGDADDWIGTAWFQTNSTLMTGPIDLNATPGQSIQVTMTLTDAGGLDIDYYHASASFHSILMLDGQYPYNVVQIFATAWRWTQLATSCSNFWPNNGFVATVNTKTKCSSSCSGGHTNIPALSWQQQQTYCGSTHSDSGETYTLGPF